MSFDEPEKGFDPLDRTLTLVDGFDDLDPFSSDDGFLRARLSCGHAVAPESLTEACRHQLEEGNYKFKCSAVVEGTRLCNKPLSYKEVRRLADLTVEEMQYFEENIARLAAAEYSDIQTCPKCKTNIERIDLTNLCVECSICSAEQGEEYLFCWQCLKPWIGPARSDHCENVGCRNYELELLKTCKLTNLPQVRGADAVPSVRACPTCGQRVEHDKTGCKNIICPRCQIEFCFVCLKLTSECLKTSSYFIPCSDGVAPRQTSIPVWRRN